MAVVTLDELLVVRGKATLDEYSGNVRVSGEELFAPYRDGKCPVQIHYRNNKASCQLRLGEAWQVTLHDDLLHGLRKLLQPENVKVVYG